MGEEDWRVIGEHMEANLQRRRHYVRHLAGLGWSKRAIAGKTGEHRRTVIRWTRGLVTPPDTPKPHKQRDQRRHNAPVVTPPVKNRDIFLSFDDEGNPDAAFYEHPAEQIEPLTPEDIPEIKRNLILTAALRYLMRMEERSMEEVAREIGCTRAAVSRSLGILSDRLGFKALNQKSEEARDSYRKARMNRA